MNNSTVEQTDAPENNPAQITLLKIREWGACSDGRDWFREKFPQGGAYGEVMNGLYADKRYSDARWLADKAFDVKNINTDFIESDVRSIIAATDGIEIDTGDGARAECTATIVFAGLNDSVRLGKGGAATLTWYDGSRDRFVHLYEGEDGTEAGTLYAVKNGKVVEL